MEFVIGGKKMSPRKYEKFVDNISKSGGNIEKEVKKEIGLIITNHPLEEAVNNIYELMICVSEDMCY
jgi:hypothetical protein